MNLKKLSDNELLNVYQSGNECALTTLVDRHRQRVFDYINMMVKDRDLADDIFQETLIRVFRFVKDGRYTENGKFISWVLRIAHNQVIDYFRKQVNELQFEDFMEYCENQATDVSPEDILLYDEFLQQLQQSKKVLSQREHEIYELSREKHIPIKQIAEQLDLSEQTVKNYLTSALKILRSEMMKYNILFIFFL